jgi:hypothetical protein
VLAIKGQEYASSLHQSASNSYTGQQVRVLWNGICLSNFAVENVIKQGGILSPVLLCVYLNVLCWIFEEQRSVVILAAKYSLWLLSD